MKLFIFLMIACFGGHKTWAQRSPQRCISKNGEIGGCVPIVDCNLATNTMYDDGSATFDVRIDNDPIKCPSTQACCLFPRAQNTKATSRAADATTHAPSIVTCGIQKPQTVRGFVKTKADEADPGEFPWAVHFMIKTGSTGQAANYDQTGSGSLIHERVVLTAAHALNGKDLQNLKAVVGDHDQTKIVLRKRLIDVIEVVMHEDFHSGNGDNNIALAFLSPLNLEELPHVGTLCLPPPNYVATPGTRCFISGWGMNSKVVQQYQLTKTEVPIMTHSACEKKLQQSPFLGPGFMLLPSLTCAGGEVGKDICGGAAGSPLACPIDGQPNRFVQTGIVSWVVDKCGVDGSPTVFADVALARPWIDRQLTSRHYSTASYNY